MNAILSDIRYAIRSLRKNPGFTAVAVIALAVGIGANSAIFSLVNAVLLRPLPIPEPDRIVIVWETNHGLGFPRVSASAPNFFDWKEQNTVFEGLGAMVVMPELGVNVSTGGEPERVQSGYVSAEMLPLMGIQPAAGRFFLPEEDRPGAEPVVLISAGLWRRLGNDPNIVGQTIRVDGMPRTAVGVAPSSLDTFGKVDVWMPIAMDRNGRRDHHNYGALARLKDGVTLAAAQTEMEAIVGRLAAEYPETNSGWGVHVMPITALLSGGIGPALLVLLGAVGLLLLIACANVANLLLAKDAGRAREIAIRTALGATRSRIVRQMLVESMVLGLIGGGVGLVLAHTGVAVLRDALPDVIPRLKTASIDLSVLAFTMSVSLMTGVVFGLIPALKTSAAAPNAALGGKGVVFGGSGRTRNVLLAAEVGLAVVLAVGAGLLSKSFITLMTVDPGVRTENVLTMRLNLPTANYEQPAERHAFFRNLIERTQSLPGVESVAAVSLLPLRDSLLGMRTSVWPFRIADRPKPRPGEGATSDFRSVTNGYFHTAGISLQQGRTFDERDSEDAAKAVVINEALARRYFEDGDAIGKQLFLGDEAEPRQIVGVVGDAKLYSLADQVEPATYVPHAQYPDQTMSLLVHSRQDPASLTAGIRREVLALDSDLPISHVRTMKDLLSESLLVRRLSTWLLGTFAGLAILLATVGIYGVTSYLVNRRTNEIGLRITLGASPSDVLRMVVRGGVGVALAGVAVGIAGAFALSRVLSGMLFGVTATDPVIFVGVPLLFVAVAAAASFLPARRAANLDPAIALRHE